jgi:membrane-bound ClpP family serine protease
VVPHPIVLGAKLILLIAIIVALVVLHAYLAPAHFRIAVIIGIALFLLLSAGIWVWFAKVISNPDSKMAKQMILSQEARSENGFRAAGEKFATLLGERGVAASPLRPSGVAIIGGKRVPVVTDGEFIPSGSTVEIVTVKGARVVVRAVTETADQEENPD